MGRLKWFLFVVSWALLACRRAPELDGLEGERTVSVAEPVGVATTNAGGQCSVQQAQRCIVSVPACKVLTGCSGGVCTYANCSPNQVCVAGQCTAGCQIGGALYASGAPNPASPCQVCDPGASTSTWSVAPNGTTCNDGNACTRTDTCQGGVCTGASPVVCAASDPCHTAGTCNPKTGACSNPSKPNGAACDDGSPCTQGDVCQRGVCTGRRLPVGTSCSDGDPCNGSEQCDDAGTCKAGAPLPDQASCGGDVCSPRVCHAGACQAGPTAPNGTSCDDGSRCTQAATCQSGMCNAGASDGVSCSDGDACNGLETCHAGACVAGTPPGLPPDAGVGTCNGFVCDPTTGGLTGVGCDPVSPTVPTDLGAAAGFIIAQQPGAAST